MKNIKAVRAKNVMLISAGLLLLLGTLAVFTASSFKSLMITDSDSGTIFLFPHIRKVFVGVLAGLIAWSIPSDKLKKLSPILYAGSVVLLLALLILKGSHWAPFINGSARWFVFWGFRIMPSEIARISYILLAASLVSDGVIRARCGIGVIKLAFLAILPAVLVSLQPDFAGAMYIFIMMVVVLFLAEARFRDMLILFLLMITLASVVAFSSEYRRERLQSWFSPGDATEASIYQPEQACIALGSGGIMGRGIGRGRQQRGFLPEAFSDYILAVIGEETGFAGVILILILLFLLLMSGWIIADSADYLFGYLVVGGLIASIAVGMFVHIAVVTRMIPSTGMPLPLVSWGGSNLLITIGTLGIVSRVAVERGKK